MISINDLLNIIATEARLPHTHRCCKCGRTFAAEKDGCPSCGDNADILPISEEEDG